mmetsp:Transcript_39146/g.94640  ORF Transcript_39146/g.94640 Transcript_39146/m.94640 type:complete len:125 (-) Transcript_39146:892-1266(-)
MCWSNMDNNATHICHHQSYFSYETYKIVAAKSVTTKAVSIPRLDAVDCVPRSLGPAGMGGGEAVGRLVGGGVGAGAVPSVAKALGTMDGMSLGTRDGMSLGIKLELGIGVGHATKSLPIMASIP